MTTPTISQLVKTGTPWEQHGGIWVKREDLCCPEGPRFSKIRGLIEHLQQFPRGSLIGVLDTIHSKGGWGAAYICRELELRCEVFFPGPQPREHQLRAAQLGAVLTPLVPGRSAVLWYRARRSIKERGGHMLPNGLVLPESIRATRREVLQFTPQPLRGGTWVISASTGTIARGVAEGVSEWPVHLVVHLGYSRSIPRMAREFPPDTLFIDEGYNYRDAVDVPCPFPCNPYYDLKAWKWLLNNRVRLAEPIVFWNIGE